MGFLTGKRVLIVGVASKLSIASGIAAAMHREGAELAFTYQNDKLKGRVEEFAAGWGSSAEMCFPCDVANDADIAKVFEELSKKWDGLDCIVHSVGFAPGDQLNGDFHRSHHPRRLQDRPRYQRLQLRGTGQGGSRNDERP